MSAGALVYSVVFSFSLSGDLSYVNVAVLPRLEEKKLAVEITRRIELDVSAYLLAITLINALLDHVAIAMFFLGLPNPVLWGVMAGLLHFIPFLGAVVGISIVTLVALVTLESTATILLVPTIYFALNLLEEYVVLPVVIGRRLMLNAVVVLLLVGFLGVVVGCPGRSNGSAAVGDCQNRCRSFRSPCLTRGVYRAIICCAAPASRLTSTTEPIINPAANRMRRDQFFSQKIAE